MEKILEGNLARFEVPDLLTFLNMGRRTGVLVLERDAPGDQALLPRRQPVFATSTREELRLGSVLVRLGKVSASGRMEQVLRQQRGGGHRIGQILLSREASSSRGRAGVASSRSRSRR